ncbi:MAG: FAD-dependent oxidoreductase [Pseudomonadota bacterium]
MTTIAIIGAGMAGLTCATRLAKSGHAVTVFDKGRGPGGRMAARRAEIAGETVSFDHGAQFFTARDPAFVDQVKEWEADGVVARWKAAEKGEGDPAWVGTPGMNGPIRAMAEPLGVRWAVRVETIDWVEEQDAWKLTDENGGSLGEYDVVICAVPAEQAAVLLSDPARAFARAAREVVSEPCWAVMAAFDAPLAIESDCIRSPENAISWAARNSAKPARAGAENWVLHASPAKTREILDMPKEEAAPHLLACFFEEAGIAPVTPIHAVAHRWLYAMPASAKGDPCLWDPDFMIGACGDYLHSPRVKGAFLSGLALADRVLETLKPS